MGGTRETVLSSFSLVLTVCFPVLNCPSPPLIPVFLFPIPSHRLHSFSHFLLSANLSSSFVFRRLSFASIKSRIHERKERNGEWRMQQLSLGWNWAEQIEQSFSIVRTCDSSTEGLKPAVKYRPQ